MTLYCNRECSLATTLRDSNGKPSLNVYGEPSRNAPVTLRCRREPYDTRDSLQTGEYVNPKYTYFFAESTVIQVGDVLDDLVVQGVNEYRGLMDDLVGYEVIT